MIDVLMWGSVAAVILLSVTALVFMLLDKEKIVNTLMYLVLIMVALCLVLLPMSLEIGGERANG